MSVSVLELGHIHMCSSGTIQTRALLLLIKLALYVAKCILCSKPGKAIATVRVTLMLMAVSRSVPAGFSMLTFQYDLLLTLTPSNAQVASEIL